MAALRRADAVEDLEARPLAPALEEARGQRLPRAQARAHAREVGLDAALHGGEHLRVRRRHAEEDRRPMAAHLVEDGLGRRPARVEHARGAGVVGKVLRVAEAVREEELRDGEAAVLGTDLEHMLAVAATADPHVVLKVDDALRLPRRPARVQKEGLGIAARGGVFENRLGSSEATRGFFGGRRGTAGGCCHGAVDDGRVDDEHSRIAVPENRLEPLRLQLRVERHRGRSRRDGTPEAGGEERTVGKDQGDPVAGAHPVLAQGRREPPHEAVQLPVGRLAFVRDDGDAPAAILRHVAAHEPPGGVEILRQMVGGAHSGGQFTHPPDPC